MRFISPLTLWLIPICIALLIASLVRQREALSLRGITIACFRIISLSMAILALSGPFSHEAKSVKALTALIDLSNSVTDQQGEELLDKARAIAVELNVPLEIIPFAEMAAPISLRSERSVHYSELRSGWSKLGPDTSNLEEAVKSSVVSSEPLVLMLSDGYETRGSIGDYLRGGKTPPIFAFTSQGQESSGPLEISQLSAPRAVAAQKTVDILATITNHSDQPREARVELHHGERLILSKSILLQPGADHALVGQSDPSLEGLQPIKAKLTWAKDGEARSVNRTIWIAGEKREKVLLLSGTSDDDRFLSRILTNEAYQLRAVVADRPDPTILGKPGDYRVIVLNNIALNRIPSQISSELVKYTRSGGGLVVIGGNSSFGLGGYIGSTLEEILPVRLITPHQEKKRLNIAVQLVIDKSRSMATDVRLEYAKSAATEVVRTLMDDDYIGVIGFDEVPFIALPLSRLSSVRDTAITRISRLFPTSRTNLFPALDEARRGLSGVQAGRKHVIVLTDGKLPDPGPYYFDLIRQMRFLGITVSTVMVGSDADDGFLAHMAESGGGAFYQTTDPSNLPKVFLSDVKVASGERTLKEQDDLSVRAGPDTIVSTNLTDFPNLRGFVETAEREAATTELIVRDADKAYPLLASWGVENGRSIAFTSDANGRWSSNWMRWERVQQFWSDIIESAANKFKTKKSSDIKFDLRTWLEGGRVRLDLALFSDIAAKAVKGEILTPSGDNLMVEFNRTSPGHYQCDFSEAGPGTYRAEISLGDDSLPPVAWDLDGALFGEIPHRGSNVNLLGEITKLSGGMLNPTSADIGAFLKREAKRISHVHTLLIVALMALISELLVRAWPRRRGNIRANNN